MGIMVEGESSFSFLNITMTNAGVCSLRFSLVMTLDGSSQKNFQSFSIV